MAEAGESDSRFMAAAIRLGASALGTTWPNPAVGAILVADGRVVGRGRTGRGGRPHGEPLALAQAGAAATGATLYVSLEPCAHHGRTPPCTEAILAGRVGRVVAALADPDRRVAGRGMAQLRAGGTAVDCGPGREQAERVHAGHVTRHLHGRPRVVLKLAISADDAIGRAGEGQVQVTGALARRHVQALRSRFDAILVGRGTVLADDPDLRCRLPGLEDRSPVRVVLAGAQSLPDDRRVLRTGATPTWILGREEGGSGHVRLMRVAEAEGRVDLVAALRRLAEEGITRLLVEGGARLARALLDADLVDEAILFRSPVRLGGDTIGALAGLPPSAIEASTAFRRVERRMFDRDRMSRYERTRPACSPAS